MPFPNEHAARQADPQNFQQFRRNHPKGWPTGVDAVVGFSAGTPTVIQSVRFDADEYTAEEAKAWLEEQGFRTGEFEPASKGWSHTFKATSIEGDKRLVFGWGYVTKDVNNVLVPPEQTMEDGTVVDHSGEVVDIQNLEEVTYDFVLKSRAGDVMHDGPVVAHLVESIVFTAEKKKALNLPDEYPEGVFLGFYVADDTAWKSIRSGKLAMFSLFGPCKRSEYK